MQHPQIRGINLHLQGMSSKPRVSAGVEVAAGYAVGRDAAPAAAAEPGQYAETVQTRRQRERRMRSSDIFGAADPWGQEAQRLAGKGGYMAPLSQRDRDAIAAETASARSTAQEKLEAQQQRQRK